MMNANTQQSDENTADERSNSNDELNTAKLFCEQYLALCNKYKAEVIINNHGVHCVSMDNGKYFAFGILCQEWNEEVQK